MSIFLSEDDDEDDEFAFADEGADLGTPVSRHSFSWKLMIINSGKCAGALTLGLVIVFVVVPFLDKMAANPLLIGKTIMRTGSWMTFVLGWLTILAGIVAFLHLLVDLLTGILWGREVLVCPKGLIDIEGDDTSVYRWEDIQTLTLDYSFLCAGLIIQCDGEEIPMSDYLTDFRELGNQIERFTRERLLLQAIDDFESKGEVRFDKISVTNGGMTCKGKFYAWPEIWKVTIKGGSVILFGFMQRSEMNSQSSTPNTHALAGLLAHLRKPIDPPLGVHAWDRPRMVRLLTASLFLAYVTWVFPAPAWAVAMYIAIVVVAVLCLRPWPPASDRPRVR